ncbi:MAG: glycosyltransferase, partial [bacterium]|nr:glycosyltransferase [bacterium]
MKLSIITVTWNSQEQIREQLRSVQAGCRDVFYEHIIVDNGSTDGTVETVQKEFPELLILENPANGFARANNMGLKKSSGEYLLFLNPDMRVAPGSLDTIIKWMDEHNDVGIASVKLVDEQGKWNEDA